MNLIVEILPSCRLDLRTRKGFDIVTAFKHLLTLIGRILPTDTLFFLQNSINYLRLGKWMSNHGFRFRRVKDREEVFSAMSEDISDKPVLYLEFGVYEGDCTRFWANALRHPDTVLHGFDSFEGLPESWGKWERGHFDTGGNAPTIADRRVKFFKGWFDEVLPAYDPPHRGNLVIIMDADIYSSTIFVLRHLQPHVKAGTLIYFDDMGQVDHEPKAFAEFMEETGLKFEPVCADKSLCFAAFKCLG